MIGVVLTTVFAVSGQWPVPAELERGFRAGRLALPAGAGDVVEVTITVHGARRAVLLAFSSRWFASRPERTEIVDFVPTAAAVSHRSPGTFYVAGRSAEGPVLERWDLGTPRWRISEAPGDPATTPVTEEWREVPSLTRSALIVDPALGNVADLVVPVGEPDDRETTPSGAPSTQEEDREELWVLEWETRNVFALDPCTGERRFVERGDDLDPPPRSLSLHAHGDLGRVLILTPWRRGSDWQEGSLLSLSCDTDRDGTFEDRFTGSTASWIAAGMQAGGEGSR